MIGSPTRFTATAVLPDLGMAAARSVCHFVLQTLSRRYFPCFILRCQLGFLLFFLSVVVLNIDVKAKIMMFEIGARLRVVARLKGKMWGPRLRRALSLSAKHDASVYNMGSRSKLFYSLWCHKTKGCCCDWQRYRERREWNNRHASCSLRCIAANSSSGTRWQDWLP